MKILIAPNSFKSSFTSSEASEIIFSVLKELRPRDDVLSLPLADGGDGTMEAIDNIVGGDIRYYSQVDEEGEKKAPALFFSDGSVFIEMARANALVPQKRKGPLGSSSFETGLLMKWALASGAKRIILGLGGSLSTDGGTGMAHALGVRFLDKENKELFPCGGKLLDIATILIPFGIQSFSLTMLSDVTNPLFGPNGAAYVYGPQKGANPMEIKSLDEGLRHLSSAFFPNINPDQSGMGAAGGMGFGGVSFFGGNIILGSEWVLNRPESKKALEGADIIITGEGKVDPTSFSGKVLGELIKRKGHAQMYLITGSSSFSNEELQSMGIGKVAFTQEFFGADGKTRSSSSLAKAVSSLFR